MVGLAGGVGAARFLEGVVQVIDQSELTVVVNTGDDEEFFGLHVSPDIDIILYTLSGIVDAEKGWGISGDTYNCLQSLGGFGAETWFRLGDRDFAAQIYRTWKLAEGFRLSEVTEQMARRLGVRCRVLPMTNDRVKTHIETPSGLLPFQRYLVERGASDEVLGVRYVGADNAKPIEDVIKAISEAEGIFVCPSNPIVSIGAILAVPGIRRALTKTRARVVGVSPIVGGGTIKGPADKMMRGLGLDVSPVSVAKSYRDFLDVFVIDRVDAHLESAIASMGIETHVADTIMKTLDDKRRLAELCLSLIRG